MTARTLERWGDDREDSRHGPKSAPTNKLSDAERRRVVAVATRPAFRDQSLKQIVPQLADRSEYVASESMFYRGCAKRTCGTVEAQRVSRRRGHVSTWRPVPGSWPRGT